MTTALVLTLHVKPVTIWLAIAVPALVILGIAIGWIMSLFGAELEALVPIWVGAVLAGIAGLLAVGSML